MLGQAIGLPVPMGLLAMMAVFVTSATVVIYGKAIWDPVDLASRMTGAAVLIALIVLLIDTVSVNLAANLVGPGLRLLGAEPARISLHARAASSPRASRILMMPWKMLETTQGYIFTWLIGYSALLGPVAGILIVDYYLIRKKELDVDELYDENGAYRYSAGWNWIGDRRAGAGRAAQPAGVPERGLPASLPGRGRILQGRLHLRLVRRPRHRRAWSTWLGMRGKTTIVDPAGASHHDHIPS